MNKIIKSLSIIIFLGLSSCDFKISTNTSSSSSDQQTSSSDSISDQQTSSSDSINSGYTVVWKNYDGTVLETDTNVSKGTTPTYNGTVPAREEDDYCTYTFTGWSPEISKVNSDITYTAQFSKTIQNAKIKFDLNGGSSSHSKSSITVSSIDASDFFFDVSKVGFNFRGWAYNNELVFDQFGNKVKIPDMEEAMTFVAMFAEDVYVKVDKSVDGGDITGEGTYDFNSVVTVSTTVSDYFTFSGWYKKNKLVSTSTSYSFTVDNDDVNLEARYKGQNFDVKIKSSHPLYGKVSFEEGLDYSDGRVFREVHQSYSYTSEVQLILYKNDDYSYAFLGWFDEEDNLISKDMVYRFIMPHNDVHYVAKFDTAYTRLSIVKNYDAAGEIDGEGIYGAGQLITVKATTTNNVFSFDGWYINNEFANSGSYYSLYIPENDLTLEARWTLKNQNFNITYKLNGGTNNYRNPAKYNTLVETTFQSPTKYGYIFEGWYEDINFTGEPVISTLGKYSNLVLYAKWSLNDYYKDLSGLDATIDSANGKVTIKGIIDKEKKEFVLKDYVVKVENKVYSDSSSETRFSFQGTIENWLAIQGKSNISNVHFYLDETDKETTSITIPNSVTSIGNYAFYNCSSLKSITIPSSVTSIASDAFSGCAAEIIWGDNPTIKTIDSYAFRGYKGTSITIPNSVTSIASDAFSGCDAEIVCGDNPTIETIDSYAFRGYKGTSITIPNSVTSIGDYAFYECTSLESVVIPNSVTSIGNYAFYNCSSLKSITIPSSVTSIGSSAFAYCTAEIIWGDNPTIETIGIYAFSDYKGTSITIPDSVTSIGFGAFWRSAAEIIWGDNPTIKTIDYSFRNYKGTSITIPNSVTSIGDFAFYECTSLKSITIPNSVTSIGNSAFYKCTSLESIVIPNTVTSIASDAFCNCSSLESIVIPNSVTSIASDAFSGCAAEIIWGDNPTIKTIDSYAFRNYNGTSITIPNSVTSIGKYAFSGCTSLKSIVIPNTVTSIGDYAFYNCSSLKSIVIPNGVTSIGSDAFSGCAAEIIWGDNPTITTIGDSVFRDYKGASITIPNSVTSIGKYAFSGCAAEIIWGDNPTITTIGDSVFRDYKGASITIPNSVTSIGKYAFSGCRFLKSITIPNTLTSIGYSAFSDCAAEIIWGDNPTIKTIGASAFSDYKGTSITIPNSVTSIDAFAFSECLFLESIVIPNGVTSIDSWAFSGCTSLESIVIPNGVTSIGYSAFSVCTSLESITIPSSVTSIGAYAFSGCSSLTSIIFQGTKSEWKSIDQIADQFSHNTSVKVIKCIDGDIEV